ncbi:flagellar hook-length control protein FliK [Nitrospinaceae bacterium]|nr:flagellar hook-length control protein FliK [Nitrospinaceae bacterium]
MIPEGFSENSLKLILGNGSLDTLPSLSKFLKSGALFQVTVLESLPEKNKAIIKMFNKQIMVETQHPLTPGHSFSARVYKPSPELPLQIKIVDFQVDSPSPSFEDKTQISRKNSSNISTSQVSDKKSILDSNPNATLSNSNNILFRELSARDIDNMNLSSGQSIKATIIDISEKNNIVVKFENKLIAAYFSSALPKTGENVSLVVTPHRDGFRLVVQQDSTPKLVDFFKIKSLLPFKEPFGEMLEKLDILVNSSEVIKNLSTKTGLVGRLSKTLNLLKTPFLVQNFPSQGSVQLKQQIDLSGINYESKVKNIFQGKEPFEVPLNVKIDLKGQLIMLLELIEVRSVEKDTSVSQRRQFMEVVKVLHRAIENIELQQLTNQFARQENQPVLLQIPDPFIFGKTVNLYLRRPDDEGKGKGNKNNDDVLLVFLLELSALGSLRVDAKMNKESISVRIDVENQNVAQFIDGNLKEFCSCLRDLGFEVNASCCVVPNIDEELDKQLNQLLIYESDRLVDLTT